MELGEIQAQPGSEDIREILTASGIEPALGDLAALKQVDLEQFGIPAAQIRVHSQVPPLEYVVLRIDGRWIPVLVNKELVPGWRSIASHLMSSWIRADLNQDVVQSLSHELVSVLVDSDSRYGIALEGIHSIPTDYSSSDVFRDLRREGLADDQIVDLLLRPLDLAIGPPRLEVGHKGYILVFYSWHYFGGEVARWRIMLDRPYKVERKSITARVGSYDYYQ
jgi:hypothetical protein